MWHPLLKLYKLLSTPTAWQLISHNFLSSLSFEATGETMLIGWQLEKNPPDIGVIDSSTAQKIVVWAPVVAEVISNL